MRGWRLGKSRHERAGLLVPQHILERSDRSGFYAKLRRARNKGQPLRIQAIHLAKRHPDVALRLLEQYFELGEQPDAAAAYVTRAEIYRDTGNIDAALDAFEGALAEQALQPGYRTSSWLGFAMLVAEAGLTVHYSRALEILQREVPQAAFPVERHHGHGARALILDDIGQADAAQAAARSATAAANESYSGFRNHPTLGLATVVDSLFDRRVADLAG